MARHATALAACAMSLCGGCFTNSSLPFGEVVIVTTGAEVQMLKPGRTAAVCGTTWGVGSPNAQGVLATAFAELQANASEANALKNLRVSWSAQNLGIVSRTCVKATADVVRTIRVIQLPSAGHQH